MHHWKAYAFVSSVSILPLLIVLPFVLRLTVWPHHITLAILTAYGLGYVWLLKSYTIPFFATPASITNLPKAPNVRFVYASGLDMMSRPPGCKLHMINGFLFRSKNAHRDAQGSFWNGSSTSQMTDSFT